MTSTIFPSSLAAIVQEQEKFPSWAPSAKNLQVLKDSSLLTPQAQVFLEELASGKARCVFTGQQLGLFLGPAFTLYKIASAIALAEALRLELKQPVVPIFWLQGDDHDFEEIRAFFFPDGESGVLRVDIPSDHHLEKVSVGRRILPEETSDALEKLLGAVSSDEERRHLLQQAFLPGLNLREAFGKLVQALFGESGLLIYDPLHPLAKEEAIPVFDTAREKAAEIERGLESDTQKLKDSGEPEQVALRAGSPLFFVHFPDEAGPRFRLQKRQTRFEAIGGDFHLSDDELAEIIAKQPSRISPSALLRPLLQDSLFPTLAYVGGDAERRYMRQISSAYSVFGKRQPFAVKRMSLFVLEPKALRLLKALSVSVEDFLERPEMIEKQVRGSLLSSSEFTGEIEGALDKLLEQISLRTADVSGEMKASVERNSDKMRRAVSGLTSRYDLVLKTRDDVQSVRFRKLSTLLFPNAVPQERIIGGCYYWLVYGEPFLQGLLEESKKWAHEFESGPRTLIVGA